MSVDDDFQFLFINNVETLFYDVKITNGHLTNITSDGWKIPWPKTEATHSFILKGAASEHR